MEFHVRNENICIGQISVLAVVSSSILKIGDTQSIQLFSAFDTPPESLVVGTFTPIAPSSGVAVR